ncbi:MAG: acyl--CoA ligase [candidate division Zixibacteria bacterium]|nr:acyl--CoA ligase [candidate division Zixibacteria bacterium]
MNRLIACPLRIAARTTPDRIALSDPDRSMTFAEWDAAAVGTVESFQAGGILPGQAVAVLGRNSIDYAVLFFAALRYGLILTPLNTRLTVADWRQQLSAVHCRLVVADREFQPQAIDLGIPSVSMTNIIAGTAADVDRDVEVEMPPDRDALLIFSSGSTGRPRGVVLTGGNLYFSALGLATILPPGPEDVWLAVLPFFHIGGISILYRAALGACGVHIRPCFDAADVLETLAPARITLLPLVPTMLGELLAADSANLLRGLKAIIVGGAAFDASLRREAEAKRLPILTTYGQTETASMVTILDKSDRPELWSTAGRVLPYREIMIASDDGEPVPAGTMGRILVRGEVVAGRLLAGLQVRCRPEDWFDTGDNGVMNASGYLKVMGRGDSIIVSGGENIDLTRIEAILTGVSGVKGAVVLARADKKWGHRPVAFVEPSGEDISEERIREELGAQLPRFMHPDRIIIVRPLPLTATGKYDRAALRERYAKILGVDD